MQKRLQRLIAVKNFLKHLCVFCVCWGIACPAIADGGDASSLLESLKEKSIAVYCRDEWFLRHANLNATECLRQLETYGSECKELILPLTPAHIFENGSDVVIFRNIGEIYSMCVMAKSFQALN